MMKDLFVDLKRERRYYVMGYITGRVPGTCTCLIKGQDFRHGRMV